MRKVFGLVVVPWTLGARNLTRCRRLGIVVPAMLGFNGLANRERHPRDGGESKQEARRVRYE